MSHEILSTLKNIEALLQVMLRKMDELIKSRSDIRSYDLYNERGVSSKFSNEYLTCDEIAREIGVDSSTVRRWLRDGLIPSYKFGRAVRVKAKDFEAYCRANEID